MTTRIERDYVAADLSRVEELLESLPPSDFLTRLSLENRRNELQKTLESFESMPQHRLAAISLFFSGQPVVDSFGIESTFGSQAVTSFQRVVSAVAATRDGGSAKTRGPVSGAEQSKLHITHLVRGSFGFQLQEIGAPGLFDSVLKQSVEQTAKIMASFDDPDADSFGQTVESIDNRALQMFSRFFKYVYSKGATLRVVSASIDKTYDRSSLERAVERAKVFRIEEESMWVAGKLAGMLPDQRRFEYRSDERGLIQGRIDDALTNEDIDALNLAWLHKPSVASIRVRKVRGPSALAHEAFFLEGIAGEEIL